METSFKTLTLEDKSRITKAYRNAKDTDLLMSDVQKQLAEKFSVTERTVRNWAKSLGLNLNTSSITKPFKVLVYDIETSRAPAMVFQTGKAYINHTQLRDEFKIISISYKWLGEDKVHALEWDKNHSDEKLMRDFLPVYNQADMVVGYNNDKYDNKWINTRGAKYRLRVNTNIKSFDLYKQMKRLMYLPSYSMAYVSKFFGVTQKQHHEGIRMWDMIQFGTKAEQKEYLAKMILYNVGDIVTTEEIYLEMRQYMGHKTHLGVLLGKDKYTCPHCGGKNIQEFNGNFTVTTAGTVQRHMVCKDDGVQFKLANAIFLKNKEV
jgi:uncharacterized protein YprB with RNaseH-like and TPR domain